MSSKLFKLAVFTVIAMSILLAFAFSVSAQTPAPQAIVCAQCQHVNAWRYKFCVNCGVELTAIKAAWLSERQYRPEAARTEARKDSLIRAHEQAQQDSARATGILAPAAAITPYVPSNHGATRSRTTQRAGDGPWYKSLLEVQAGLPRLFNVPTAGVLGSLDLYFTGGGAFGIEKERNFLGRAGMGLGDIAEVEFATQAVINSLQRGSSTVPTSAFKMLITREREQLPAVAVSLRGTTSWRYLQGADYTVSFETRLTKLYIVASKKMRSVRGHVGVGLTDVRVRNPQGWRFANSSANELQRNLWAPFAGVSIQANPKAQVMFEIEGLPSYNFTPEGEHGGHDIKNIWAGVVGVRFYFTNWLAADTGVRYRSDFDGIADANIQANLNMLLPLGKLRSNGKGD